MTGKKLTIRIHRANLQTSQKMHSEYLNHYVTVSVKGADVDAIKKKTKQVKVGKPDCDDCLTPVWEEDLTFEIRYPEMAELQFQVKHIEGGVLANGKRFAGKTRTFGSFTISVLKLAHLIGDIPLTDENGNKGNLHVSVHMKALE